MERFTSFDGTTIAFRHRVPTASPGAEKLPVVLLHGFMASSESTWGGSELVEALLRQGRAVIDFDARGHGGSDRPRDAAAYARRAMARDLSALLDHLALGAVGSIGSSLGGFTLLEAAAEDPRIHWIAAAGVGHVATTTADYRAWGRSMRGPRDAAVDPFSDHIDRHGGDRLAAGAWLGGAVLPQLGEGLDLGSITAPVLIVNGRDDPVDGESLATALPRGRALRIAGEHGSVHREPAFAEAVSAFAAP